MTPTELEILRRHAKPGHEDALVDIVTLMLDRAKAEQPQPTTVPMPYPVPVAPTVPQYPISPLPDTVPYPGYPWPWTWCTETWTDNKITIGDNAGPNSVTTCTVIPFDGTIHTDAMCPHGRRASHACPHCMGIAFDYTFPDGLSLFDSGCPPTGRCT